jgi:tetratricopeptide (TPR) repeat protein
VSERSDPKRSRRIPSIAAAEGSAVALAELRRRKTRFARTVGWQAFDEREMNSAGYDLLRHARMLDALDIFRANAEAYPNSGNVWDSYGEALLAHGDTAAALASYRRAVARDQGNDDARRIVQRLGGG